MMNGQNELRAFENEWSSSYKLIFIEAINLEPSREHEQIDESFISKIEH